MNRSERGNSGMCVGLILLTNGTTFNILTHKGSKARLPEFRGNQLMGF